MERKKLERMRKICLEEMEEGGLSAYIRLTAATVLELAEIALAQSCSNDPWVPCSERLPTAADADGNGYVLAWFDGNTITPDKIHFSELKAHAVHFSISKSYWMPPPAGPKMTNNAEFEL